MSELFEAACHAVIFPIICGFLYHISPNHGGFSVTVVAFVGSEVDFRRISIEIVQYENRPYLSEGASARDT